MNAEHYDAMATDIAKQLKNLKEQYKGAHLQWDGLQEIVGKAEHDRIVGNLPPTTEEDMSRDRWA